MFVEFYLVIGFDITFSAFHVEDNTVTHKKKL